MSFSPLRLVGASSHRAQCDRGEVIVCEFSLNFNCHVRHCAILLNILSPWLALLDIALLLPLLCFTV